MIGVDDDSETREGRRPVAKKPIFSSRMTLLQIADAADLTAGRS